MTISRHAVSRVLRYMWSVGLVVLAAGLPLSVPAAAQESPPSAVTPNPDANPSGPALVLEADQAGLKGIVGHWWYLQRYGDALLDEYVRLGVTNVRLAVDWRDIEEFEEGQRSYPEVRRWEFWNEPEMWAGLRRASDFEPWYRAFHTAAKSVDPQLEVGVGTLSGWDFVSKLSPDLPMDAVSMHPYAGDDWGLDTRAIQRLHDGLLARGVNVPIWVTEYGWAQWMDPVRRARTLSKVFDWMRTQPYIQLADYHMLQDAEEADECCWGLVGPAPSFAPHEPAYSFFSAIAVSGRKPLPGAHPARTPAPRLAPEARPTAASSVQIPTRW